MKVSREEVSKHSGISRATVSCVLNGTRKVSEKTRQKVLKAVEELNYIPDMAARSMRIRKSYQIATVINDIANPMFSKLVSYLEEEAMRNNYFLVICGGHASFESYVENMIARHIDGVYIAVNIEKITKNALERLENNDIRVVMGGSSRENFKNISLINVDIADGMKKTIEHLCSLGHKDIAFMSCFPEDNKNDSRVEFFKKYTTEQGLKDSYIYGLDHYLETTIENGYKLAEVMYQSGKKFTALMCANDLMAIGAVKYLREQGLYCPQHISITGVDNNMLTDAYEPTITTFGPDYIAFSKRIFDRLVGNDSENREDIVVPVVFHPRESTGKPFLR